jgi:hypothetical protein
MGELAALGLVLAFALAGSAARPRALRLAATAAAGPLGMGLYLSFSRGALFAWAAGVVALAVARPRAEAWRGAAVALGAAVLGAVIVAPWHPVTSLAGPLPTRERDGAIVLVSLAVVMALAALLQRRLALRERPRAVALPRRAAALAAVLICAGLAVAIVAGAKEQSSRPLGAGATRLATLQSNRYAYWRVAFRAFGDEPLRGVGAGGWSVYWLRYRPFGEFAQDAHSLELQTLAELGAVGVGLLALWLAATALAAGGALRRHPGAAAGPLAAGVAYLAHSPLDWDWQMPAVTLVAIVLAGLLLALADEPVATGPPRSAAPRG